MTNPEPPDPKTGGSIHPIAHYGCVQGEGCRLHPGLTIRDYFAGKALGSMLSVMAKYSVVDIEWKELAEASYALADAMLKARSG